MHSTEAADLDQQTDTTDPTGSNEYQWVVTVDEDEHTQWWRRGCTHVQAQYTRLDVQHLSTMWVASVRYVNRFGVQISSRTLLKDGVEVRDSEQRVRRKARIYRQQHPAQAPFDGIPSVPEPGQWELVQDALDGWEWSLTTGTEPIRLAVEQNGRHAYYGGSTDYYNVTVTAPDETVCLVTEETTTPALRAATRSMQANPDFEAATSVPGELMSLWGLGAVRCRRLGLLGVQSRLELAQILRGNADRELVEVCRKIVPTRTREQLCGPAE